VLDAETQRPQNENDRFAKISVEIDKDVVRRVLAKYCRPTGGSDGPSRLTFLGHAKGSLWSVDLFRCESLIPLAGQSAHPSCERDRDRTALCHYLTRSLSD
jgi:hypothetical protein